MLIAARVITCAILRSAHRRGWLGEPTLIIGAGPERRHLATLLDEHSELGLADGGFLDHTPTPARCRCCPWWAGCVISARWSRRQSISRVIVCDPAVPDAELASALRASRG